LWKAAALFERAVAPSKDPPIFNSWIGGQLMQSKGTFMSKSTKPSPARLKQIIHRQNPPGFGSQYIPAIKANREEAPARSRPAWVWWARAERDLSTLSSVELEVLVVCLYNSSVWEVHDQRMLPTLPSPHPLHGHPKASGMILPPLRGTVDVADALGMLKFHPVIRVPAEDLESEDVPFPFIGDLLLFLEDHHGPYNVNLNIKSDKREFEISELDGALRGNRARNSEAKTKARHTIEARLYSDVGIRTLQLSKRDYDDHVVWNLLQIFGWHARRHPFNIHQVERITKTFNGSFATGEPAIEVAWTLCADYRWQLYDIKTVLHQAIWNRQIRIDLFQPFLFDRPLIPERRDVLTVYSEWFKR
jgi:hypothetical protein